MTAYYERAERRHENLRSLVLGSVFGSVLFLGTVLAPDYSDEQIPQPTPLEMYYQKQRQGQ